jgi:hypothetical protein
MGPDAVSMEHGRLAPSGGIARHGRARVSAGRDRGSVPWL